MKIQAQYKFYIIISILIFAMFSNISCSANKDAEDSLPARYGEFGKKEAIALAEQFPERYAGSEQEKSAADWLIQELEELDYQPEVQTFTAQDAQGNTIESQNIIITIDGSGFSKVKTKETESEEPIIADTEPIPVNDKFLVITAHYDTPIKEKQVETSVPSQGNGIHNNAAAVGSLLTLAKQLKTTLPGYRTKIVFLGASEADHAGARAFLAELTDQEIMQIEALYNLERIYAGDKVYAHAGLNSIVGEYEKSYPKRHKVYELTDVYYNNLLLTNNKFALYTNQNVFLAENPENGKEAIYREWTTTMGDQTPFDEKGIPIVFIESYEYDVEKFSDLGKETTDPNFNINNGIIDRSNLDSTQILNEYFQAAELEKGEKNIFGENEIKRTETEKKGTEGTISLEAIRENKNIDRLERRVNNIAFLLLESTRYAGADYELNSR